MAHFLHHHVPSDVLLFDPVVTRGFRPPKPSPAGILHIAKCWGVVDSTGRPSSPSTEPLPLIMIGDSIDDMVAGHEAGALTVLLRSEGKHDLEKDERTHVVVDR